MLTGLQANQVNANAWHKGKSLESVSTGWGKAWGGSFRPGQRLSGLRHVLIQLGVQSLLGLGHVVVQLRIKLFFGGHFEVEAPPPTVNIGRWCSTPSDLSETSRCDEVAHSRHSGSSCGGKPRFHFDELTANTQAGRGGTSKRVWRSRHSCTLQKKKKKDRTKIVQISCSLPNTMFIHGLRSLFYFPQVEGHFEEFSLQLRGRTWHARMPSKMFLQQFGSLFLSKIFFFPEKMLFSTKSVKCCRGDAWPPSLTCSREGGTAPGSPSILVPEGPEADPPPAQAGPHASSSGSHGHQREAGGPRLEDATQTLLLA